MPARTRLPAPLVELEAILAEANDRGFASEEARLAWLAERGVRYAPSTGAVCDRCRFWFASEYEPDVPYGGTLRARCFRCGGPLRHGS